MTGGKPPDKVRPSPFHKTWEMGPHFMHFQRNDARSCGKTFLSHKTAERLMSFLKKIYIYVKETEEERRSFLNGVL